MSVHGVLDVEAQVSALTRVSTKLAQYAETEHIDDESAPGTVVTRHPRKVTAKGLIDEAIRVLQLSDAEFEAEQEKPLSEGPAFTDADAPEFDEEPNPDDLPFE